MAVETSYYTQKKDRNFLLSIIFLVFVILISSLLYGWQWYLGSKNQELTKEIATITAKVKALEMDKKLQILDLVRVNKTTLDTLAKRSQITSYIEHLKSISGQYDIIFEWFNFANGAISTKWILKDNEKWLAFVKLATFIDEYRKNKDVPFNLSFINAVNWQDQIEVTLTFKLK
jgi:ABC-type Na+ efflux pump permease subunit